MKIKQLILAFGILMPMLSTAQVDETFLKDYKYPDLRRQTLDIGTGFFARANQSIETRGNDPSEKFNRNNFSTSGSALYTLFINNRKWQNTIRSDVDGDFRREKEKESLQVDVIDRSTLFNLNLNSTNRLYSLKESFLEFNLNGKVNLKWMRHDDGPNGRQLDNEKENFVNIHLGVGKGRLEYISDASMAQFILKDFGKLGILEKEVSTEDAKALSDLIAQVRYERFFDGRHKLIYQLTKLDSLLQQRGIIDNGDAASFTTLYDNWFYGFNEFRYSGSSISFGLRGAARFSKFEIEEFLIASDYTTQTLSPGIYANYQLEIPINLFFHHSLNINTVAGLEEYKNSQNTNVNDEFFISGELGYKFDYYPNTRTSVSALLNFRGGYSNRNSEAKSTSFSESLRLQTYYYLSPRARIGANLNFLFFQNNYQLSNTFINDRSSESFSFDSRISFGYAIF